MSAMAYSRRHPDPGPAPARTSCPCSFHPRPIRRTPTTMWRTARSRPRQRSERPDQLADEIPERRLQLPVRRQWTAAWASTTAAFAVGLLKASIGNLTGDANGDGLPDAWQIDNFGANFATQSPRPAPTASTTPTDAELDDVCPGAYPVRRLHGRQQRRDLMSMAITSSTARPIPSPSTRRRKSPLTRRWASPTRFRASRPSPATGRTSARTSPAPAAPSVT